jgi:hypothetical protein
MKQEKIKKLEVVSGNYYQRFEVGVNEVTKIKDHTVEYGDHCDYFYEILSGDKTVAQVQNVGTVVYWENEGD